MDRFTFYYELEEAVWGDWKDLWTATFPLKIVCGTKPETIVDKENPRIEWVSVEECDRAHWIELPSLYHIPVRGPEFDHLPLDKTIALPIVEHGWLSYTCTSETGQDIYFAEPREISVEFKLSKEQWTDQMLTFLEKNRHDVEGLDMDVRRRLCGIALALKEWRVLQDVSPLCEWPSQWVQYDVLQSSKHLERRHGATEHCVELQKELCKLDCPPAWHDLIIMYDLNPDWDNRVLSAELLERYLEPWTQTPPPLGRWVMQKQWSVPDDYMLYFKLLEKDFFKRKLLQNWKMRFLFSHIRYITDRNTRVCFTQGILGFLPRLCHHPKAERGTLLHSTDDIDFVPSSSSLMPYPENPKWYIVNVRKVNYRILPNGSYVTMRNGKINSEEYNGISKNEFYLMDRDTLLPVAGIRPMSEEGIPNKRENERHIVGLEDIRLVPGKGMDILFYAVTRSFSYMEAIRIISGKYDFEHGRYTQTRCIHPPYEENACEKNWTWCGHNRFIYRWHPIEIGYVENDSDKLIIEERIATPPYFGEFRGSSPVCVWKGYSFFSVHSVSFGDNGRRYIHYIVVLDLASEKKRTIACTSPFCFEDTQIEYTIGLDIYKGNILFLYSTRDSTARYVRVPFRNIIEKLHFTNQEWEEEFHQRVLNDF